MASDPDPVQVAVELLDSFSSELEKIEAQLQKVDGTNLNVLLDIDDGGDATEVEAKLKALEKQLESILNIKLRGHGKALTIKELLEQNTESTHVINTEKDGDVDVGDGDGNTWKGVDPPSFEPSERIQKTGLRDTLRGHRSGFRYNRFAAQDQMRDLGWSLHDQGGPVDPSTYLKPEVNTSFSRTRQNLRDIFGTSGGSPDADGGSKPTNDRVGGLLSSISGLFSRRGVSDPQGVGVEADVSVSGDSGSSIDQTRSAGLRRSLRQARESAGRRAKAIIPDKPLDQLSDQLRKTTEAVEDIDIDVGQTGRGTEVDVQSAREFDGEYREEIDRLVHEDISRVVEPSDTEHGAPSRWDTGFETRRFTNVRQGLDTHTVEKQTFDPRDRTSGLRIPGITHRREGTDIADLQPSADMVHDTSTFWDRHVDDDTRIGRGGLGLESSKLSNVIDPSSDTTVDDVDWDAFRDSIDGSASALSNFESEVPIERERELAATARNQLSDIRHRIGAGVDDRDDAKEIVSRVEKYRSSRRDLYDRNMLRVGPEQFEKQADTLEGLADFNIDRRWGDERRSKASSLQDNLRGMAKSLRGPLDEVFRDDLRDFADGIDDLKEDDPFEGLTNKPVNVRNLPASDTYRGMGEDVADRYGPMFESSREDEKRRLRSEVSMDLTELRDTLKFIGDSEVSENLNPREQLILRDYKKAANQGRRVIDEGVFDEESAMHLSSKFRKQSGYLKPGREHGLPASIAPETMEAVFDGWAYEIQNADLEGSLVTELPEIDDQIGQHITAEGITGDQIVERDFEVRQPQVFPETPHGAAEGVDEDNLRQSGAESDFMRSIRNAGQVDIPRQDDFDRSFFGDLQSKSKQPLADWDFFDRGDRDAELSFRTKAEQQLRRTRRQVGGLGSGLKRGGTAAVETAAAAVRREEAPDASDDSTRRAGFGFGGRRTRGASRLATGLLGDIRGTTPDIDMDEWGKAKDHIKGLNNPIEKVGNSLRRAVPSIRTWYNLLALLIPLMVTLAGGALGLAAALGSVAGAAFAIGGLGLMGLEDRGERIKRLKEQLAGALEPAAETFAPFMSKMMDRAPNLIGELTGPLQGLQVYEGFLEDVFAGGIDFIRRIIVSMSDLAGKIQQISMRFGKAFGNTLIKLLRWSVKEVYRNQDAFAKLGHAFAQIVAGLYQLMKVASFFITSFTLVFEIMSWVAALLDNKFVAGILSAIAAFVMMTMVAKQVAMVLMAIGALSNGGILAGLVAGIATAIGALYQYIATTLMAIGVTKGLAAALAATGVGAVLAIAGYVGYSVMDDMDGPDNPSYGSGGMGGGGGFGGGFGGGSGMQSGGGTTVNNFNIQGSVDDGVYEEMKQEFPQRFREQSIIEDNTRPGQPNEANR